MVDALDSNWVDKLENVLSVIRTMPKKLTEETPFHVVYGSEEVSPVEIAVSTHGLQYFNSESNNDKRRLELDMASDEI